MTSKQVLRAGRIVGSLTERLDKVFQKAVACTTVTQSQGESETYREDIRDLVADLLKLNLFQHVPGRTYKSLSHFPRDISLKKPGNLKTRIQAHSRELDNLRDMFLVMK